jgi:hypothetical protein
MEYGRSWLQRRPKNLVKILASTPIINSGSERSKQDANRFGERYDSGSNRDDGEFHLVSRFHVEFSG